MKERLKNVNEVVLWFLCFVHFSCCPTTSIHVCTTFSGAIMVIQLRSVGHVLSWHGEHQISSLITSPVSYYDSVYLGSLVPISITTGRFRAPAKWLGPESNAIKSMHRLTITLNRSREIEALIS